MQHYRDTIKVDAPIAAVFAFYVDVRNLGRMVPPKMGLRVVKADSPLREGALIRFTLRPRGIPLDVHWVSRITEFREGEIFTDRQIKGPFDHWVHRHEFRALDDGHTEVCDSIEAGAPLGFLGPLLEGLFLGQGIQTLFDHRRAVLRREFPPKSQP